MRKPILIAILLLSGATLSADEPASPIRIGSGYLAPGAIDSLALLPPIPAPRSGAEARDKAAAKAALAAQGTPRWTVATADADLFTPAASGAFSCAAGFEIGPQTTPALDQMLRRSMIDFGMASSAAKKKYQRPRPFMTNKKPTCTPGFEDYLRKDGSYPSGHSAIGMGWGMVLAQLVPDRASPLVARGRAFGESRRFCNVHWLSDVEEGRIVGAAVFARLQADPAFQADLAAARQELATTPHQAPQRDCGAEAAALAGG